MNCAFKLTAAVSFMKFKYLSKTANIAVNRPSGKCLPTNSRYS